MLHTSRHDQELALPDPFAPVAKLHAEAALDHKEHFIFILMMVKHELTEDLVQLDVLPVQFSYDVRLPVLRNLPKLLGHVDLVHVGAPRVSASHIQIRGKRLGRNAVLSNLCAWDLTIGTPNESRQLALAAECCMLRV